MKIATRRLEALSDGVIAIIMTIMAFSIPLPNDFSMAGVTDLLGSILVYFVSFFVVGSQWDKHHHLFDHFGEVSSKIVWRNILYLFFLSLVPLFTKWVIQNPSQVIPAIGYDIVYILVAISYQFMASPIIKENPDHTIVAEIKKRRTENNNPIVFFILMFAGVAGILVLSFFQPTVSIIFFIGLPVVASLLNLWGDRRIKN